MALPWAPASNKIRPPLRTVADTTVPLLADRKPPLFTIELVARPPANTTCTPPKLIVVRLADARSSCDAPESRIVLLATPEPGL